MINSQKIKKLLKENNISALKKFGQNFLISQNVLNKIIETADIKPTDKIIEVGPGLGALTLELAKKANKVIAIEKDNKFFEILKKNIEARGIKNVEVIKADALCPTPLLGAEGWGKSGYKLVANLPYNIATTLIMKFLENNIPPEKIVVMVQKEVAQRIVASPPKMNKLAIFCQIYSNPKIIDIVPSKAFYPKPKVDSAILQLIPIGVKNMSGICLAPVVSAGFSHPRKTLLNNFLQLYKESSPVSSKEEIEQWLKSNGISPSQRPETLTIDDWLKLTKTFQSC